MVENIFNEKIRVACESDDFSYLQNVIKNNLSRHIFVDIKIMNIIIPNKTNIRLINFLNDNLSNRNRTTFIYNIFEILCYYNELNLIKLMIIDIDLLPEINKNPLHSRETTNLLDTYKKNPKQLKLKLKRELGCKYYSLIFLFDEEYYRLKNEKMKNFFKIMNMINNDIKCYICNILGKSSRTIITTKELFSTLFLNKEWLFHD